MLTKWLVIGSFKPGSYPLYSWYVWRTELTERIEENLAEPALLTLIGGTIWMSVFARMMGAKVGARCVLDRCVITEPDLVTIGDNCVCDAGATLQAHLFQDRIRTTDTVVLGDDCSVGSNSVVLLGAELEDKVSLAPLSLAMRSEVLPRQTKWHGIPAEPYVRAEIIEMQTAAQDQTIHNRLLLVDSFPEELCPPEYSPGMMDGPIWGGDSVPMV